MSLLSPLEVSSSLEICSAGQHRGGGETTLHFLPVPECLREVRTTAHTLECRIYMWIQDLQIATEFYLTSVQTDPSFRHKPGDASAKSH